MTKRMTDENRVIFDGLDGRTNGCIFYNSDVCMTKRMTDEIE